MVRKALWFFVTSMLLAACGGGSSTTPVSRVLPPPAGSVPGAAGPALTVSITEYPTNANGVNGAVALGYDGALWFTQNNGDVARFALPAGPVTATVQVTVSEFNFLQTAAVPQLLVSTPNGVYTNVELFEEQGFAVENEIVQIPYSKTLLPTNAQFSSVPAAHMEAMTAGNGHVYATGTYDELGAPPQNPGCSACMYVLSDLGQTAQLTTSADAGKAIAFLDNVLYIATSGGHVYTVDAASFSVHLLTPLPSGSSVAAMTAGPDAAIWFTDAGRNAIGRLTPAGSIVEFPVTTPHAGVNGITQAADGALWFTEADANKVGRITTAGAMTEYALPTPNAHPEGIAGFPAPACAPQSLWVAETAAGQIVRLTY